MYDPRLLGNVKSELPEELVGQLGTLNKEVDGTANSKVTEIKLEDLPITPPHIVVTS